VLGARIMSRLFDPSSLRTRLDQADGLIVGNWRGG
jgi:hypothetical protein